MESSGPESGEIHVEPPCYTDLNHGWDDTGAAVEEQVVVTMEEVDQAITRNAPQADMTRNDMKTIKRLTETVLRRNAREQGVLPTELQREITIAHVITNFNKTKMEVQAAASQELTPRSTAIAGDNASTVAARALGTSPVKKQSATQRVQIGVWTTLSTTGDSSQQVLAYADQVPKALVCMVIWLIVSFFIGTPLTLLWTIPALNGIIKTKKNVKEGNMRQAKRTFKTYLYLGVIFNIIWTVFFVIITAVVVGVTLAVLFSAPQGV